MRLQHLFLYGLSVAQTGFQSLIPSMAETHLILCSWVPSIGLGCWLEPSRDRLCWNKQKKEQVSLCRGFFIKPFHVYYQPRPGTFMICECLKLLQLPWAKLQSIGKSDRRDRNGQGEQDFVLWSRLGEWEAQLWCLVTCPLSLPPFVSLRMPSWHSTTTSPWWKSTWNLCWLGSWHLINPALSLIKRWVP